MAMTFDQRSGGVRNTEPDANYILSGRSCETAIAGIECHWIESRERQRPELNGRLILLIVLYSGADREAGDSVYESFERLRFEA